jgi:hypothetical protein
MMPGCVCAYHEPGGSILVVVSTPQRRGKASLGLLAAAAGLGCCLLVAFLVTDVIDPALRDDAVLVAWASGIVAVLLSVLAVQEHGDPDDDPRYLTSLVHGLRQEWRR